MQITQDAYMRLYNQTHREKFNPFFFQRSNREIMDSVKKIIYSCERDGYFTLKVKEINEIYDYEEIYNKLRYHEENRRKKNNKTPNSYDTINIKDSDIMLLEVKWFMRHNGEEIISDMQGHETRVLDPWDIMTVYIALPRFEKKYYFRLNGNYYSDIFQIVDGSTYNNSALGQKTKKAPSVSMKTMFAPIRMFKMFKDVEDFYSKTVVRNAMYTSIIHNYHVTTMDYILANYGFYGAQEFLDIRCVFVNSEPIMDDRFYNFEKNGIYVSYPKECAKDAMVQSFAMTVYNGIMRNTTLNDLFETEHWLVVLGKQWNNASIEKGIYALNSIDGAYDLITEEELHLPKDMKANIYQILRWMMQEFNILHNKKNNVDVTLKRVRIGQAIAHTYAMRLANALYALADQGKKVSISSIKRRIYTPPMYVINQIVNMSNLVEYRDFVNDNDASLALKWTFKGISGLGENGSVQTGYRNVDPSHVGILDLDSSTTSDPGMSGTLCPMAKMYGDCFSEFEEPHEWKEKYKPIQDEFFKSINPNAVNPIQFTGEYTPDYLHTRQRIIDKNLEIDKKIVPLYDLNGGYDYSLAGTKLREEAEEQANKPQSLFTIVQDDEDEE